MRTRSIYVVDVVDVAIVFIDIVIANFSVFFQLVYPVNVYCFASFFVVGRFMHVQLLITLSVCVCWLAHCSCLTEFYLVFIFIVYVFTCLHARSLTCSLIRSISFVRMSTMHKHNHRHRRQGKIRKITAE